MFDWLLRMFPEFTKFDLYIPPRWTRPTDGGFVHLPDDMIRFMQEKMRCPYCKSELYEGPSGGASVNMFCGNPDCNSRFNVGLPPIPFGEFTGPCPESFLNQRRTEIAAEKTAKILGDEI